MLAKLLCTKRKSASAPRCLRCLAATIDIVNSITRTANRSGQGGIFASMFTKGQHRGHGDHWAWRLTGNYWLAVKQPKLPKGRPSTQAAKQAAGTKKRLAGQRAALFTSRYLFVQRHLNKTERKTLWRLSCGLPQLRTLRAVMEQVYALFDRRCRTQTALDKLAKLRRRVQRFTSLGDTLKKLFAPTLDKALTFL